MQVQETYVKVATRLFNRRWTNVTPCLLLETKALCEILSLWKEGRKACTRLFFASSLPFIPELQETEPSWALVTHLGSVYLMVDFAVPGTSFPILPSFCNTHADPYPFPFFSLGKFNE